MCLFVFLEFRFFRIYLFDPKLIEIYLINLFYITWFIYKSRGKNRFDKYFDNTLVSNEIMQDLPVYSIAVQCT